jgi:precorrin-3B synthase
VSIVRRILATFADHSVGRVRRMRDVIAEVGIASLRASIADGLVDTGGTKPARPGRRVSLLGLRLGRRPWFGLGVPFGAAAADMWMAAAAMADQFGDGQMRVAPDRSILVTGVQRAGVAQLAEAAQQAGFIVEEGHPLMNVQACAGAPACAGAFGETRALARGLAEQVASVLRSGATMHVSGCNKSCAGSGPAEITVVLSSEGSHLGFAMDVADASRQRAVPLTAVTQQIASHCGYGTT